MDAHLLVSAVWTKFEGSDAARDIVSRALTVTQPGYRFTKAARYRGWDGSIKFFRKPQNLFLAGLTMRVVDALRAEGISPTIALTYERPIADGAMVSSLNGKTPRDYQREAAEGVVYRGRLSAQLGTGGGKTLIGAEVIRQLNQPTLWLTHQKDLAYQTRDELSEMLGVEVGFFGDSQRRFPRTKTPVVVALVQTLKNENNQAFWELWRTLILDECQFASADTWYQLALKCTGAVYRIGLSGTVRTGDPVRDFKLEGTAGKLWVIPGGSEQELIGAGFLAKPTIEILKPPSDSFPSRDEIRDAVLPDWRSNPRKLRTKGGAMYAEAYRRGITENDARNQLFTRRAIDAAEGGARVMMMCVRLGHGIRVAADLKRWAKVPVWWINGSDKGVTRRETVEDFKRTSGGCILVVSKIFDAGIDIPEIDILALMGGGESSNTTFQRVGRSLRKRPGKDTVLIWDSQDGRDPKDSKDYLAKHFLQRASDYAEKGYEIELG